MELFSKLEGRGPTLVFNHGWTMSHRCFARQEALRDRFRLLLWDLPGHGDSEKSEAGYSLADASAALHELLRAAGVDRAVGLGWSMGAEVLWDYARRYGPAPFSAFVNLESVPWGDPARFHVPGVTHAFHRDRPRAARKFVKSMFYHPPEAETLDGMVADSLRTPTLIALKYYAEIAHADYREAFAKLPVPVHSLLARHGFHRDQGPALRDLRPADELVWFEASGHMPFWEEAEAFNAWVTERFGGG